MDLREHIYTKTGREVSLFLTLLLFLLFVGLPVSMADENVRHDLGDHLEKTKIGREISSPVIHAESWYESNRLASMDRLFHPISEKSAPPRELLSVNEPAGEDERKLLPHLTAPFAETISKAVKQRKLQAIAAGSSLVRDLALQSLSTVILLN